MPNPLLTSINRAVTDNRETALLFARFLGTAQHPRGRLLTLYRDQRKAMKEALGEGRQAAIGVLNDLQREGTRIITAAAQAAVTIGQESATTQVTAYARNGVQVNIANQSPPLNNLTAVPLSTLSTQIQGVTALILGGASEAEIIGDGTRLGMLQPAPVQRDTANWLATAVSWGFSWWLDGDPAVPSIEPLPFRRQAVAGIDERTTNCCLQVHGQIVGLNEDFRLTGTPRYADFQHDPPFHDWCRTSVTLYLPEFDEGYTELMRQAAELETRLRGTDGYKPPHPANAFTRIRR